MASSAEDHFAILTTATEGFDVMTDANQSFAANALRDLVADGKGLTLSIEPVSGASIVVNRSLAHDLGGAASGLVTFLSEHVEPRNDSLRGRVWPPAVFQRAHPTDFSCPSLQSSDALHWGGHVILNDLPSRR